MSSKPHNDRIGKLSKEDSAKLVITLESMIEKSVQEITSLLEEYSEVLNYDKKYYILFNIIANIYVRSMEVQIPDDLPVLLKRRGIELGHKEIVDITLELFDTANHYYPDADNGQKH